MRVIELRLALCAVFLLLASWATTPARANSFVDVPIDSLWVHADCVVEGEVLQVWSGWMPDSTNIRTWIQLDVQVVHAGPCVSGVRTLGFLGGEVDTVVQAVLGAPRFAVGEHVLLFLDERPGVYFPTLGLSMGKFTIAPHPVTGVERFVNDHYGELSRPAMAATRPRERR